MQQRQATATQFATKTVDASRSAQHSAPVVLDMATLKLVAGGTGALGPNGGWLVVPAGPNGGW